MFKKRQEEAPAKEDFNKLKQQLDDGSFKKDLMGDGKRCCGFVDLELGMWFLGAVQIIYAVQGIFAIIFALCFFLYFKGINTDLLIYLIIMTIF